MPARCECLHRCICPRGGWIVGRPSSDDALAICSVDEGRVVRDGNILSGGGVTAGIDFVLALIAELRGPRAAEMVQLGLEYAPQPPFNSGRPDTAPAEVLEAVNARTATSRAQRRVRLDAWAAAHRAGPEA